MKNEKQLNLWGRCCSRDGTSAGSFAGFENLFKLASCIRDPRDKLTRERIHRQQQAISTHEQVGKEVREAIKRIEGDYRKDCSLHIVRCLIFVYSAQQSRLRVFPSKLKEYLLYFEVFRRKTRQDS